MHVEMKPEPPRTFRPEMMRRLEVVEPDDSTRATELLNSTALGKSAFGDVAIPGEAEEDLLKEVL